MFSVQKSNYRGSTMPSFPLRAIIATTTTIALSILTEACAPRTCRTEIRAVIVTGYTVYLSLEIVLWLLSNSSTSGSGQTTRTGGTLGLRFFDANSNAAQPSYTSPSQQQPAPSYNASTATPTSVDQNAVQRRQKRTEPPKSTYTSSFSSSGYKTPVATPTSVDQNTVQRRQKRGNRSWPDCLNECSASVMDCGLMIFSRYNRLKNDS